MELPILYSFKRCPYAMRARMAIFLTDTICEIREIKLIENQIIGATEKYRCVITVE